MRHFPSFEQRALIGQTVSRVLIGRTHIVKNTLTVQIALRLLKSECKLKNKKLSLHVSESRIIFIVPTSKNNKSHE